MTTYEELLTEVRTELEAFNMITAKKYVPKLWEALKNENPNLSREDLRSRIGRDCKFWSERTVLMALPDEAKDQKKQEFARLSQKKRISAATTAAPPALKKKEIILDTAGKPIEHDSASPTSSDGKEDKLYNKEHHFKSEFSIPIADMWMPMLKLAAVGEDKIWFEVVFENRTNHVISAGIGEKSRQITDNIQIMDEKPRA